eukprot:gb/GEZN01010531.1/.p1 GENE.gb/GEZN01010531.1/~~gb/GEZN01010531.1/.p1  ORF type:complete len:346 (+),score=29.02 gb/GEZN01010531.1/:66-1103(+)
MNKESNSFLPKKELLRSAGKILLATGVVYVVFKVYKWKTRKYNSSFACDGDLLEKIEKVVRPTDIITCTPSKCGQTWLQNILFNLKHKGQKSIDTALFDESPWVECPVDITSSTRNGYMEIFTHQQVLDGLAKLSDPRIFKMHVEYNDIPFNPQGKKCKVITITRDPRDVAYSMYKHMRAMGVDFHLPSWVKYLVKLRVIPDFKEDKGFERYFYDMFLSSWNNLFSVPKSFWPHRHEPHVLWLRYEDLQKDLRGQLNRIVEFLEWDWCDDQVIETVIPLVTIEHLRSQENVLFGDMFSKGKFFREGKVGKNRQHLTKDMESKLIALCKREWPADLVEFMFAQGPV